MKVTHVAICPSEASRQAGRPALTPELLAASGARYSRNNEGLESILARIDPARLEQSVDAIFRMVDYGHQSIADMVPVAMFIDGISVWLAYYIWTLCPTAGGQESSTRYLRIEGDDLLPPEVLGIPEAQIPAWRQLMRDAFQAYQAALEAWQQLADAQPALMGIPQALLADPAEAARKKVARLKRNYAFDRARYFLPVAAATNLMLVMSARGWVNLCQFLLSHPLPEPRAAGELIRQELQLSAPRMLKHAGRSGAHEQALASEFEKLVARARASTGAWAQPPAPCAGPATPLLALLLPEGVTETDVVRDFGEHRNRYAPVGTSLQRTSVRFGWSAIAFAEIRDLNRHRTGTKFCPQVPAGFYSALDQVPAEAEAARARLLDQTELGRAASCRALDLLRQAEPAYIYWSLLGTEYPFEHTTTADKFIYQAELRTGLGAHYRYAKHLRDVLALWYERFPATRGVILEGSAEPE